MTYIEVQRMRKKAGSGSNTLGGNQYVTSTPAAPATQPRPVRSVQGNTAANATGNMVGNAAQSAAGAFTQPAAPVRQRPARRVKQRPRPTVATTPNMNAGASQQQQGWRNSVTPGTASIVGGAVAGPAGAAIGAATGSVISGRPLPQAKPRMQTRTITRNGKTVTVSADSYARWKNQANTRMPSASGGRQISDAARSEAAWKRRGGRLHVAAPMQAYR